MALAWTQSATSGTWTLGGTGTDRTALVFDRLWLQNHAFPLRLTDRAHGVSALVVCSGDGLNGYQVGVDYSDPTRVSIRQVDDGVVSAPIASGAADTPTSSSFSVAHGVPSGTPLEVETRTVDGVMEVRVNGTLVMKWTTFGQGDHAALRSFGFVSSVVNATVLRPQIFPLVERSPVGQAECLIAVCDGNVWFSINGDGIEQIDSTLRFGTAGTVTLVEFDGKVYGLGGGKRLVIDLTTTPPSIAQWTAVSGTFPGTDSPYTGDTRMTLLESFLGRLYLAGDPDDPRNYYTTAIGDPTDFDYGDNESPGRAFASSTGLPNKIGAPIVAMKQATKGVLTFGCLREIWRQRGDPILAGLADVSPVILGVGVSGKNALNAAADGLQVGHSPDAGAILIPSEGEPTHLSRDVLTEGIQFPSENMADYLVSVVRDPTKHETYFFLTPRLGGSGLHFTYEERIGRFMPGLGGFQPDEYPEALNPTCAVAFMGRVLMGTRDGRIIAFDDNADDDAGEALESFASLWLLKEPDTSRETILGKSAITPGMDSGEIAVTVYGGRTSEEAFTGSDRDVLFEATVEADEGPAILPQKTRAPALVMQLGDVDGSRWSVERVEVATKPGKLVSRHLRTPTVHDGPCSPPADTNQSDGGGTGTSDATSAPWRLETAHYGNEVALAINTGVQALNPPSADGGGGSGMQASGSSGWAWH